ncbi:MAG: hypothetical protein JSV16_03660 [Candidatus Hydrogenedentota bacterium]|nr:MAG: hypothetical protein JSV16_03660 [Candidatus Hydrogenedentota bacterium]
MKRFVWRLQRVLDVAVKQEQVKKAELLEITEMLTRTRSELLAQKRILDDIMRGLAREDPQKRLGEQELFLKYSTVIDKAIKELEDRAAEIESKQAEKIAEVLKARKFKQGLEKLQAEAEAKYIRKQEALEQKELDERTVLGFARMQASTLK